MAGVAVAHDVSIGAIVEIPRELIRVDPKQPRRYFDPRAMEDLANSIAENGQYKPVWVRAVTDDPNIKWQLIDGERRWRACGMRSIPTLRAEVKIVQSEEEAYVKSVVANWGAEGHTPLETAESIARVREIYFGPNPQWGDNVLRRLAGIFVKSTAWVQQYLSLLKLDPVVQAMMDPHIPESSRLKFQVAITLTNLPRDQQIELAQKIVDNRFRPKEALNFVRTQVSSDDMVKKNGARRSPDKNYQILYRFLTRMGEEAEMLLQMSHHAFERMFQYRSVKDLESVVAALKHRQEQLKTLEQSLDGMLKNRLSSNNGNRRISLRG